MTIEQIRTEFRSLVAPTFDGDATTDACYNPPHVTFTLRCMVDGRRHGQIYIVPGWKIAKGIETVHDIAREMMRKSREDIAERSNDEHQ